MLWLDTGLTIYLTALALIMGAVMGSFLNCMAWRIAHGESVWKGRSHCATCGHKLGVLDLIPVFSWMFLRGRCRYCHEKISPRYMFTEMFMAVVFVSILYRWNVSLTGLRFMLYSCVLLVAALVDLECFEIPDSCHVVGILIWIATLPWVQTLSLEQESVGHMAADGLAGGLIIAGALLVLSLIFDKVLGKESLGGGDIKLLFVTGLYLGLAGNLLNLIVSCILGLLFAVTLAKKNHPDPGSEEDVPAQAIPWGPSIACATWICMIVGQYVTKWYLGLFY